MGVQERQLRERQARIEMILRAGLQVFSQYGYHNASMDLIAEQAELGKSTLYYYYKSKDELLYAILENGVSEFFLKLEKAFQHTSDTLEKIQKVTEVSVQFLIDHPDFFKLYLYLSAHPSYQKHVLKRLRPLISHKIDMIRTLFEEAREKNLIRDYPIREVVSIFGSLVMSLGVFYTGEKPVEAFRKRGELINQIFLRGILKEPNTENNLPENNQI